jgi:hypothetical protein
MDEHGSLLATRSREGKTQPATTRIGRGSLRQRREMKSPVFRVPKARALAVACGANERLQRGVAELHRESMP